MHKFYVALPQYGLIPMSSFGTGIWSKITYTSYKEFNTIGSSSRLMNEYVNSPSSYFFLNNNYGFCHNSHHRDRTATIIMTKSTITMTHQPPLFPILADTSWLTSKVSIDICYPWWSCGFLLEYKTHKSSSDPTYINYRQVIIMGQYLLGAGSLSTYS